MKYWIPTLAAVVVVVAGLALMNWQFSRADEKAGLLQMQADAPQVQLTETGPDAPRFARISAHGRFDADRQVLLDNQVRNTAAGVHVYTPFMPDGSDRIYLVNRGWWNLDRRSAELPDPRPPRSGPLTISGVLNDPPEVGLRLGEIGPLDLQTWPNLITYYDHARLREAFGPALAEQIIQLDPDHPAHTTGDPWTTVVFGPERHRAYAFQWASIALAVFVIWALLSVRYWRKSSGR